MAGWVRVQCRGRAALLVPAEHELFVTSTGPPVMQQAAGVRAGDYIGIRHGEAWSREAPLLPLLPTHRRYGTEKALTLPARMTPELALLLGAYAAEGCVTRSHWTVRITNSDDEVLQLVQATWRRVFGLHARIAGYGGRCSDVIVASKRLVEFLSALQCGDRSTTKRVPPCIYEGTREDAVAFLRGFALDAYTVSEGSAKWAICLASKPAIDDLQELLRRLGIVTSQIAKYNATYNKHYYELYAAGSWAQELCSMAPFLERYKQVRAERLLARNFAHSAADVIPGISGRDLYDLIPPGRPGRHGKGTGRQRFRYLCDSRTQHATRHSVLQLLDAKVPLPKWITDVIANSVHFYPVESVEVVGDCSPSGEGTVGFRS